MDSKVFLPGKTRIGKSKLVVSQESPLGFYWSRELEYHLSLKTGANMRKLVHTRMQLQMPDGPWVQP